VFGRPDEHWGERVAAAVVLRPGEHADEAVLDALCREQLAGYKRPRAWFFVDEIPKNVSGKVLKRVLRDQHGG
jgi:acyl-CoA synthetase (AMP-forming)/AMP-acid ligase II